MWLTIYMFFLHFVADFLLQSREMGKQKSENFRYLFIHVGIQMIVMFAGLLYLLDPLKAYQIACINALVHGIIDWNIWRLYKYTVYRKMRSYVWYKFGYCADKDDHNAKEFFSHYQYWEDHWFYLTIGLDQFLHFSTIVLVIWMVL